MPRYFFHVRDGVSIEDREGTELADLQTAQREAVTMTGEILKSLGDKFWTHTQWLLEVCNEDGEVLFVLRFSGSLLPRNDP
ncbi:MAG: hypothetical protein E7812_10330 [Phenylobacterium sp.]|nr:MAG: hypothetical protein E7812_10330 [Phenylobacterium sp.]